MLVLTRKLGQRLKLGDDIYVTVVRIDKNTVRLGVDAPDDLVIQREEIAFERRDDRSLHNREGTLVYASSSV